MIHQIEEIWRQTRDLPPKQRTVVNQLFSEIETLHQRDPIPNPSFAQRELDLRYNNTTSNYYEPKWFSTNGQIQ